LLLEINEEQRQDCGYELMRYKTVEMLAGILHIMSGTPGVGQVEKGDRFVGRAKSGQQALVSQEWLDQ
jgi:hypothetical protein